MFNIARIALPIVLLAGTLVGCGSDAQVFLDQPLAPPSQRQIELAGDAASCAVGGPHLKTVAEFALPGSVRGPRAFVLYVATPATPGVYQIDPASEGAARGFLIQLVGQLAGRANSTSGTLEVANVWLAPDRRKLTLDVACDDGTRLTGQLLATQRPEDVAALEREFAADVAQLDHGTATTRPGTEPRRRQQP